MNPHFLYQMKIWENKYLFKELSQKKTSSRRRSFSWAAISIFGLIQVDGLLPARPHGDSCNTVIQRFDIKQII